MAVKKSGKGPAPTMNPYLSNWIDKGKGFSGMVDRQVDVGGGKGHPSTVQLAAANKTIAASKGKRPKKNGVAWDDARATVRMDSLYHRINK
jgi:hypothetical protein